MADLAQRKNALRNQLRTWRSSLSEAEVDTASSAITRALQSLPAWTSARAVAAFFGTRGEPNTRELLDAVLDSGRELWLPRITKREMFFEPVTDLDALDAGTYGIPAPSMSERGLARLGRGAGVDLVVVPGVAFGPGGVRLGQGGGYYDRYLGSLGAGERPFCVGICLHGCWRDEVPCGPGDARVDVVATERGVMFGA